MKYRFFLLISVVFSFCASAENLQVVFPKSIHTAESVEIQYVFQTETEIFPDSVSEKHLDLSTDFPSFEKMSKSCKVTEVTLDYSMGFSGSSYRFTMKLVPWKTGKIDFPAFDLGSLVRWSLKLQDYSCSYSINLSAFEVLPLIDKDGTSQFKPEKAPLLIPGTTAHIVFLSVFLFLLLLAFVFVITRIPAISRFIRDMRDSRVLRRIARIAIKKMDKLRLSSQKIDDEKFALLIQKIIREFIESRFNFDFKSVVTSEIPRVFEIQFGDLLCETAEEAVMMLYSIFLRTDYIRFACGQIDSAFKENERAQIIQDSIKMIKDFDFDIEDKQEDEIL